jgi:hypothetical protein
VQYFFLFGAGDFTNGLARETPAVKKLDILRFYNFLLTSRRTT